MMILIFKLEKATFKNWSREYGYFTCTPIIEKNKHCQNVQLAKEKDNEEFEKLIKRHFQVKHLHQNKISEKEFRKIRQKLSHIVQHARRGSVKIDLKNEVSKYELVISFLEDKKDDFNYLKSLFGDSSFTVINKDDFF